MRNRIRTIHLDRLSDKFIGGREEFSMQHRAFHAISVFTFFILILGIGLTIYQEVFELGVILTICTGLLFFIYYQSRYHGRLQLAILTYSIFGYIILFSNYYYNSGIIGPTFFLFFMSFQLLIAISPIRIHWIWMCLHVLLAFGLLSTEYYYPEWIVQTYKSREFYFIDIGITYLMVMVFMYFITSYLLKNYNLARQKAEQQAIEIKKQHTYLENLNIEKDKMLAIISHDLRSPLASIQGFLETLNKTDLTESTRDLINQQLLSQTKNTSEMLRNLLHWSQSQLKGGNIMLEPVSVQETLDTALALQIENASKKGVSLQNKTTENLYVLADQEMLQVVIRNLLNNAIKFTPKGGLIILDARVMGNLIDILVSDNGIGIPENKKEEIFSMNIRTTEGTQNEKGIGLGLLLCKEYIERQNGSIRFESHAQHGTTFFITLPRSAAVLLENAWSASA